MRQALIVESEAPLQQVALPTLRQFPSYVGKERVCAGVPYNVTWNVGLRPPKAPGLV